MSKVEFNYRGNISVIQCQENQKMVEICNIFITKSNINKKDLFFVYDGIVLLNLIKIKHLFN